MKKYIIFEGFEIPVAFIFAVKDRKNVFLDKSKEQDCVMQAFNALSLRDRLVLWQRFGFEGGEVKTLEEVGKQLSVTRERVRQIESRAIGSLVNIIRIADGKNEEKPLKSYIPRKQIKKSKKELPEFELPYCREYESLRNKACRDLGCHFFPAAAPEAQDWIATFKTHVRTCDTCQRFKMVQRNVAGNYEINKGDE